MTAGPFKLAYRRLVMFSTRQRRVINLVNFASSLRAQNPVKWWGQRYLDLAYLMLRWGSLTPLYYAQEMHKRGTRVSHQFIPYPIFRSQRNACNSANAGSAEAIAILLDKQRFHKHFSGTDIPIPETLLEIADCPLPDAVEAGRAALHSNAPHEQGVTRLFFKPAAGIKGLGNFTVRTTADGFSTEGESNNGQQTLLRGRWIIQKQIRQAEEIGRLHPNSLNTLRVITHRDHLGETHLLLAYLRVGMDGHVVDNSSGGGIAVPVDPATGRLGKTGLLLAGEHAQRITRHPTTALPFGAFTVPDIGKALEMAIKAHRSFSCLHTVGWDIAPGESGPILLEGNDDWGGVALMWMVPRFEKVFRTVFLNRELNGTQFSET